VPRLNSEIGAKGHCLWANWESTSTVNHNDKYYSFTITPNAGFQINAVPEPHEYAVFVGLGRLGFVTCHRRNRLPKKGISLAIIQRRGGDSAWVVRIKKKTLLCGLIPSILRPALILTQSNLDGYE
jgi:hypothetical protein